jgi:hypothetical protein
MSPEDQAELDRQTAAIMAPFYQDLPNFMVEYARICRELERRAIVKLHDNFWAAFLGKD